MMKAFKVFVGKLKVNILFQKISSTTRLKALMKFNKNIDTIRKLLKSQT